MMKLRGKSREEIEAKLARHSHKELVGIICSLATVEEHFTPAEIARRRKMSKQTVIKDIRSGRFGGEYFQRTGNQLRVSATGVNAYDRSCRVAVNGNGHGHVN